LEKFVFAEGYNKALDDVIVFLKTSDAVSVDDLVSRLEKSKISFNEVEFYEIVDWFKGKISY